MKRTTKYFVEVFGAFAQSIEISEKEYKKKVEELRNDADYTYNGRDRADCEQYIETSHTFALNGCSDCNYEITFREVACKKGYSFNQ